MSIEDWKYEAMRAQSDEFLIEQWDIRMDTIGLRGGITHAFIRDELHRRQIERSQNSVEDQTATIRRLTWAITGLTIGSVAAAIVAVVS